MSARTFTVQDALNEIWLRLKGYGVSSQHVGGDAAALAALTLAEQMVMTRVPVLSLAGSLAKTGDLAVADNEAAFPADCMIPKRVAVPDKHANLLPVETFVQMESDRPDTNQVSYAFFGSTVLINIADGEDATLYYVGIPTLFVAAGTALDLSPLTFPAVCMRAALTLLLRYESINTNLFKLVLDDYEKEIASLIGFAKEPQQER